MIGLFKGRYAIVGTHCCGKTTLARELYRQKLFPNIIDEIASTFPKTVRGLMAAQKQIISTQIDFEDRLGDFISDRSVIDNISYCWLVHRETGFSDPASYKECVDLLHSHLSKRPYDAIFMVDEFFPLVNDGNRSQIPEYQQIIFDRVKRYCLAFSDLYEIPVVMIKGPNEARVKQVIAACNSPLKRTEKISPKGIDL